MPMSKAWHRQLAVLQGETVPHLISVITRRIDDEASLPSYFTDKPISYYEGLLAGTYSQIENILHVYNKYNGYSFKIVGVFENGEKIEHRTYHVTPV